MKSVLAAPILELSSTTAIKAAVAEGVGPAVLSSPAVTGELADGTLVSVRVLGLDVTRAAGHRVVHAHRRLGEGGHGLTVMAVEARTACAPACP